MTTSRREALTLKHPAVNCDSPVEAWPGAIVEWRTCIRVSASIVLTLGLLASVALQRLWAFPAQQPRSLNVSPTGVTLTANQRQRFAVISSTGESVPVVWSVSGLDCDGSTCGTIDDDGNYQAPNSLPHPIVVVLEGALVSDPKHSVLTRIQLVSNAVSSSASNTGASTPTMQTFTVPERGKSNVLVSTDSAVMQDTVSEPPVRTDIFPKPGVVVTYRDRQLTIDAENTTLVTVLKLVAEKTGAVIQLPPGSGHEPIVEHAGPGPANEVLTQLLNGSHFNFVIVSSAQHPNEPEQVLLSTREDTQVDTTVAAQPAAPALPVPRTPPDNVASAPGPTSQFDSILTPPKEQLSPEALGDLMKEKAREIREKAQQLPPQ